MQSWDKPLLGRKLLFYALKQQRNLVRASRFLVLDRCMEEILAPA